jgi:hypothetical protein
VYFSSKGRSQFINQLEEFIAEQNSENNELRIQERDDEPINHPKPETFHETEEFELTDEQDGNQDDFIADEPLTSSSPDGGREEKNLNETERQMRELETVMNNGMHFLAGLFKISTGKDPGIENQTIEVDKQTGEVVMRFKLGRIS